MPNILDIKNMEAFHMRTPASAEQISVAETGLGLCFASEYREYLLAFGCASVYGHELTGICSVRRLDVVAVTQEERKYCPDIPAYMYVVEQTHYDDIVIWQSGSGEIYQTRCDSQPVKIFDSLYDYLNA